MGAKKEESQDWGYGKAIGYSIKTPPPPHARKGDQRTPLV